YRQPEHAEHALPSACSRVGCDAFEVIRGVSKREATVPHAVLVPAFKMLSSIAEQHRARRHQLACPAAPVRRTVLKRSRQHDGNRNQRMPLFEWTVLRPEPADQILHRPSFTGRQHTSKGASLRGAMACQSLLEFDRNFCQECPSDARL